MLRAFQRPPPASLCVKASLTEPRGAPHAVKSDLPIAGNYGFATFLQVGSTLKLLRVTILFAGFGLLVELTKAGLQHA